MRIYLILTTNATESSHKLATLLRFVGDDLQGGTEALVVVGQPFEQWLRLHQLHFDSALVAERECIERERERECIFE